MRILKEFALPVGAFLLVLGIIVSTMVPAQGVVLGVLGGGLALLLTGLILDRKRVIDVLRGRKARAAGASAGYALTVVAVVVLVNFLASRHPMKYDATENKAFTLSEQTTKVVSGLPRDVSITAFFRGGEPALRKFEDLVQEYEDGSGKISYRNIDPDKNPGEAKRYGIAEVGTIVVESGKQEARINTSDEESLTNALIKVTRDRERIVYFTTGHGERDLDDAERDGLAALKGELEKQHYVVKPLVLNQGVPADATLVIIAGAQKPLLQEEVGMVRDYLARGGRLFHMQDPEARPGLSAVLAEYGVGVRDDVVIDKVSQLFGGDARVPMVADGYDEFHAITKTFRFQTFFPLASSVDVESALPEGVTATKLAQTSQYSWGESSAEEFRSGRMQLDPAKDVQGPVTIAAALTRRPPDAVPAAATPEGQAPPPAATPKAPETRLLVFGDSDFASNAYFNASGNGDLALNSIAWLAEQDELVSIRPKTSTPRIVILAPQQVRYYFWSIVAFAPLAIVSAGVGIWWRRKKL